MENNVVRTPTIMAMLGRKEEALAGSALGGEGDGFDDDVLAMSPRSGAETWRLVSARVGAVRKERKVRRRKRRRKKKGVVEEVVGLRKRKTRPMFFSDAVAGD